MPNEVVTGKTSSDIENVDWSTGTVAGPHFANVVRFGSSSSQASQSSGDICRICHCESDPQNPLLTPCYCSGSLKYVHQTCLQQWLTASETNSCELCKFPFIMHTKIKPFNEWRSLDMSSVERRRLCCAVLFHCAAALCVIWSLCVLIERAAEEVKRGLIGWPFWTKLAVVTVGLTGGVVFMYIQCRQYLHLCHRWRARNRILLIQNAPEKIHPLSHPSPVLNSRHIPRNNSATAASAMTANSFNYSSYGGYSSATCGNGSGIVGVCNNSGGSGYGANGVGGGGNRSSSTANANISNCSSSHVPLHGQIVANIENNSQSYDRDWTLDDVSQISSFRPCQQGSGSMTPFHDSVHNVLENSRSCSNSISGSRQDLSKNSSYNNSNRTNDLDLFKTPSVLNACDGNKGNGSKLIKSIIGNKYPNSSVFLENQDILNDADYPKINYRHSSVLMSPDISDNLDKFLGKDLRRYSDTKLLQSDSDILNPRAVFNVGIHHAKATSKIENDSSDSEEFRQKYQSLYQQQQKQHQQIQQQEQKHYQSQLNNKSNRFYNNTKNNNINETLLNAQNINELQAAPQITDIIFENSAQFDPIELNIQKILDIDGNKHQLKLYESKYDNKKKSRHSLNTVDPNESEHEENFDKKRLFFKSLPNLSNSCESLIKK